MGTRRRLEIETLLYAAIAVALLACSGPAQAPAPVETDSWVPLTKLRDDAARVFIGDNAFNETSALTLEDHHLKHSFVGKCEGVAAIRKRIVATFEQRQFKEIASTLSFPKNAVHFVRSRGDRRDILIVYFGLTKANVKCVYELGEFSSVQVEKPDRTFASTRENLDELLKLVDDAISGIGKQLVSCASDAPGQTMVCERLRAATVGANELVDTSAVEAVAMLRASPMVIGTPLAATDLYVVDFARVAARDELAAFETANCRALRHGLPLPAIVCNRRYLLEIEAVSRKFEAGTLINAKESTFADMAIAVRQDPARAISDVKREASFAELGDQSEWHMRHHLALYFHYVLAHELGHVHEELDGSLDSKPATHDARGPRLNVLKMCRHADELRAAGYRLPGPYGEAGSLGTAQREVADQYRREREVYERELDSLFVAERRADAFAESVTLGYLEQLKSLPVLAGTPPSWLEVGHIMSETVMWVAMQNWFASLHTFLRKNCTSDDPRLMLLCLTPMAEGWLSLASIFGDVHRTTLLRAVEHANGWLAMSSKEAAKPEDQRTIWITEERLKAAAPVERAQLFWEYADLQTKTLLSMLLDVPIKVSVVGCTAGWQWFNPDEQHNNSQWIMWDFFRLEDEVARMTR